MITHNENNHKAVICNIDKDKFVIGTKIVFSSNEKQLDHKDLLYLDNNIFFFFYSKDISIKSTRLRKLKLRLKEKLKKKIRLSSDTVKISNSFKRNKLNSSISNDTNPKTDCCSLLSSSKISGNCEKDNLNFNGSKNLKENRNNSFSNINTSLLQTDFKSKTKYTDTAYKSRNSNPYFSSIKNNNFLSKGILESHKKPQYTLSKEQKDNNLNHYTQSSKKPIQNSSSFNKYNTTIENNNKYLIGRE